MGWLVAGGWLALSALACGSSPVVPPDGPAYDPEGQTKCSVAKSQQKPLIVEWPSADRMALETQLKGGLVPVRYTGCEMEVLSHCRASGEYRYIAATRQDDVLRIRNEDELYASIPVYAASFEGALSTSGQLTVSMSMVGRFLSDRAQFKVGDLDGACQGATHVIVGTTVGAFEFYSGADSEVGVGVDAQVVKVGGRQLASKETINKAGATTACDGATTNDEMPPSGCGALIRIEVVPIEGAVPEPAPVASQPSAPPEQGSSAPTGGSCDASRLDKSCKRQSDCCSGEYCDDPCGLNSSLTRATPNLLAQDECPDPVCRTIPSECRGSRSRRTCRWNSDCCHDERCYDPCKASLDRSAPATRHPNLLAQGAPAPSCTEESYCRKK
ncbi:MAG: hypothetical protein JRI68_35975 [Deltaproteobacteria bacterium]|nr:hypothetical protein [Deltaproteobacteria bacterium]